MQKTYLSAGLCIICPQVRRLQILECTWRLRKSECRTMTEKAKQWWACLSFIVQTSGLILESGEVLQNRKMSFAFFFWNTRPTVQYRNHAMIGSEIRLKAESVMSTEAQIFYTGTTQFSQVCYSVLWVRLFVCMFVFLFSRYRSHFKTNWLEIVIYYTVFL